ncbi:hypothetical protein H0H93_011690 [Arthromyces matolae]|nr:hypothetical protein H0H93_011690 [Arthromyces matolae]
MDIVQYHQDIQNQDGIEMDTTPILRHSNNMDPAFIPPISPAALPVSSVATQLMQQSAPVFPSLADPTTMMATTMHASISDLSQRVVFITPMEITAAPHIPPDPSIFEAEIPTIDHYPLAPPINDTMNLEMTHPMANSPPAQIASQSVQSAGSSYVVPVASSLESALEPVPTRSRGNTSVSPVSIPSSYISTTSVASTLSYISPEQTDTTNDDVVHPPEAAKVEKTVVAVESILETIEQTAKHARAMMHQRHDLETGSSIDILSQKINEAVQQFSELLTITNFSAATTSYPPLQSPAVVQELKEDPLDFALPSIPSATTHLSVALPVDNSTVSDQSRKRCASALEQTRSVKAPKREPQDDVQLVLQTPPAVITPPFNFGPLSHPPIVVKTQITLSRPPTPPTTFAHGRFSPTKPVTPFPTPPIPVPVEFSAPSISAATVAAAPIPIVTNASTVSPSFPGLHSAWSDSAVPTRHHHSLSSGSHAGSVVPTTPPVATSGIGDPFASSLSMQPSVTAMAPLPTHSAIGPPIGRMSRSGSISGTYSNSWFMETSAGTNWLGSRPQAPAPTPNPPSTWFPKVENHLPGPSQVSAAFSAPSDRLSATTPNANQSSPEDDDDDDEDEDDSSAKNMHHSSSDSPVNVSTSSDVPQEYRADVDRIFFEYLNKLCLEATDAKGEPIHQRLMAKKMQRLDESHDFRPFKFRIQAFTMAFLEELASQGYPEEKIPMKKIRNYLWHQPYILRFNEDGKKAKSKGNHIWNIDAKKLGDGKWEFRPFHRRLAGPPPTVAYVGLKWTWSPHVWDPQASWQNVPVSYSSPALPSWLSWNDGVLSGIPPVNAEDCHLTVIAQFNLDGQEGQLSHTFQIAIAPFESKETAGPSHSRRPSLAGDPPKRSTSDSVLVQGVPRTKSRALPARRPSPESPDTRVIRVLQSVAQRVTEEAQSQISQSPPKHFQELVKQKEVLEHSVTAYDKAITHYDTSPPQSRMLAVAAQNVVVQAAHQVIADRAAFSGNMLPPPQSEVAIQSVTVMELSDATQDAIAAAVKQKGHDSTEVDIMVAATSILKSRTEPIPSLQAPRPHATVGASRIMPKNPAYPLSSVSEYV